MRYISELRDGENVHEIYYCKSRADLKTKAGKNYVSVSLQDKTGLLDGKIWELTNGIEHFSEKDYILVEGQLTVFQGALQLNIRRLRKCREGEYDPTEYMPCSKKNIEQMYQELLGIVSSVKNPYLGKLLKRFFVEDTDFIKAFKQHSAAKTVHHGFIGGLLEHTLSVALMCDAAALRYPIINRDLLITAALFHDVGKLRELSVFPDNDYTDEGQLLGHIYLGAELIERSTNGIPDFPVKLKNELKHCILAHHGELEFGSPKKPAIIEALALSFVDNMDAKLESMTEILEAGGEKQEWLGFSRWIDSNVRRTGKV